jgi:hypothetical protein
MGQAMRLGRLEESDHNLISLIKNRFHSNKNVVRFALIKVCPIAMRNVDWKTEK